MPGRRRRSVPTTTLAFSLVISAVRAAPAGDGGDQSAVRHDGVYRRRLAQSAAEAFAHWTPQLVARAIPLDLKIDRQDDTVYIAGEDGYMTSYAEAFAGGRGADVSSEYWDSILHVEDLLPGDGDSGQAMHHKSSWNVIKRLYPEEEISSPALRGRRDMGGRRLDGEVKLIHLDDLEFSTVEVKSTTEADEDLEFDIEFEPDIETDFPIEEEGRGLQWKTQTPGQGSRPVARNARKNNNNNNNNNARAKKKRLPRMNSIKPTRGALIKDKQTFSAKILPSQTTKSKIDTVYFTLTDGNGKESAALTMPKVSNNEFAISIDGFDKFSGTRWKYKVEAIDRKGRKKQSGQIVFRIQGVGNSSSGFASGGSSSSNKDDEKDKEKEEEEEEEEDRPLKQEIVRDSNWPHGGHIQGSVGRILFEFDGSAPFVCSGTVIMDSSSGKSPSSNNGRSVIQTAAHCAYNDVLKMFATKAIFIPDQVSTTGVKSDFNCDNDRLGCWYLAFAVVEKGWASGSFPENVEYDYAYYVAIDDFSTHQGGFTDGLSGKLDHDVTPMPVDFGYRVTSDFLVGLGYSADKDPDFRYCSMECSTISGVPWYENLWLENCGMTGGASGGPWIVDMTESGKGTLVSVNSWGFTDKPGMAGPSLRTASGSAAECLFDKARTGSDPGNSGGYIVNC